MQVNTEAPNVLEALGLDREKFTQTVLTFEGLGYNEALDKIINSPDFTEAERFALTFQMGSNFAQTVMQRDVEERLARLNQPNGPTFH